MFSAIIEKTLIIEVTIWNPLDPEHLIFFNRMMQIDNGSVFPVLMASCNSGIALVMSIETSNPNRCKADPSFGEISEKTAANVSGLSEIMLRMLSIGRFCGKDPTAFRIPEMSMSET